MNIKDQVKNRITIQDNDLYGLSIAIDGEVVEQAVAQDRLVDFIVKFADEVGSAEYNRGRVDALNIVDEYFEEFPDQYPDAEDDCGALWQRLLYGTPLDEKHEVRIMTKDEWCRAVLDAGVKELYYVKEKGKKKNGKHRI